MNKQTLRRILEKLDRGGFHLQAQQMMVRLEHGDISEAEAGEVCRQIFALKPLEETASASV